MSEDDCAGPKGTVLDDWCEATDLLLRARFAFDRIAEREPAHERACALARLTSEIQTAAGSMFPEIDDAFQTAALFIAFAKRGRPRGLGVDLEVRSSNGKLVPDDNLDLIDRCLRLATSFIHSADAILEGRALPEDFESRLSRAEKAPTKTKRLGFLAGVAQVSWAQAYLQQKGNAHLPVEAVLSRLMRPVDVYASNRITLELASKCIDAWRKRAGQRGKWDVLAAACDQLGFEPVKPDDLKTEWAAAVRKGEVRDPAKPQK